MAELTPLERLQPVLLDRLTDDEPDNKKPEPRDRRVFGKQQFRAAVLRDLGWLFNSIRMGDAEEFGGRDLVARSVVNFGLPALSGSTASSLDVVDFERAVRQAILDFEPRIDSTSLDVQAIVTEAQLDRHNVVSIVIRGQLWATPVPLELVLRTDVDLETGQVEIHDLGSGGAG